MEEKYIELNLSPLNPETFIKVEGKYNVFITGEMGGEIYFNAEYFKLEDKKIFTINKSKSEESEESKESKDYIARIYVKKFPKNFSISLSEDENVQNSDIIYKFSSTYISNNINTNIINGSNIINSDNSSFMLMRTNPLLTGNIKLVIDSKNTLFIDTFKINDELSKKKYRKVPTSAKSYYSHDVKRVFKDIDSDSLYGVPEMGNNYDNHTTFSKQYIDTYNYGVKINDDRSYSENFSMLAPLWINDKLPDFFIIFRVEDPAEIINETMSSIARFKKCIDTGKIIKSFDMRKNSELGNYLRNIQSEIDTYKTSTYITFDDAKYNEWYGISLDYGIITKSYESTYDINKIPDSSQVYLDNYITNGYKRNRMLNPYLINCEFMFDDEASQDMKINQYVGFYISNILYDIVNSSNDNRYNNLSVSSHIYNITYDSIISHDFIHIKHSSDINKTNNIVLSNNILSSPVNKISGLSNFITIKINEPLKPGEHIRIIDKNTEDGKIGTIFDVCGCIVPPSISIDDYYTLNSDEIINYYKTTTGYITIHNNIFCGMSDDEDINDYDIISKQIKQIVTSFNNMTDLPFNIINYDDRHISFMANNINSKLEFERISHLVYNDETLKDNDKNVITYYNDFKFESCILNTNNTNNLLYMPLTYNIHGNRIAYITPFIKATGNIYTIPKKYYNNQNNSDILVKMLNNDNGEYEYSSINNFKIEAYDSAFSANRYNIMPTNIIMSPIDFDNYIFSTNDKIYAHNNIVNLYTPAIKYLNVAGILPVKDFNFNVLDKDNKINNRVLSGTNTQYDEIYNDSIITKDENISNYIQINSIALGSIENFNDYKLNKLPLITPTTCKWNISGKDILGNEIKLSKIGKLFNSDSLYLDTSSNTDLFFGQPTYKYDNNVIDNKMYINNNIWDEVVYNNNKLSIRDYMLTPNGSILNLISNDKNINRFFSRVYYKNDALECIIFGRKVILQSNSHKLNLKKFNNYLIMFINATMNDNYKTPEIIIDTNNKTILCINYMNSGNITYSNANTYLYTQTLNNDSSYIYFSKHKKCVNLCDVINDKCIPTDENIDIRFDCSLFIADIPNDPYSLVYNARTYDLSYITEKHNSEYYIDISDSSITKTYVGGIDIDSSVIIDKSFNNTTEYLLYSKIPVDYSNNIKTFKDYKQESVNVYIKSNNVSNIENGIILDFVDPILNSKTNKHYYYYYANPEFYDILEFHNIDNNIITNGEYIPNSKITVAGNTLIKNVNDIKQLWINKVYNKVPFKTYNLEIDVINNFNVFKNIYDNTFYRLHYHDKGHRNIKGLSEINNIKTFFGSCALSLPSNIKMNKWDRDDIDIKIDTESFNTSNAEIKKYNILINITNTIKKYFMNNSNFVNSLQNINEKELNNYIENIIYDYYIINNKNNIKIYKSFNNDINIDNKVVNYTDNKKFEEIKNINIDIIEIDGVYYLQGELPMDEYQYAFEYIVNK